MIKRAIKKALRLEKDESGASLILISIMLPAIFGMAAFSIDLGYMYYINSRLQNAADIAALAGGTKLSQGDKEAVEAQALEFMELNLPSSWAILDKDGNVVSGPEDSKIRITPTIVSDCSTKLADAGLPCYAAPGLQHPINYLKVSLGASAPMFFASGLGFQKASLSSDAVVTADGSTMPPLNVAIVLDSTRSMTTETTLSCGGVTMTKLACAKQAALGMLTTLWPIVDKVALYSYPGVSQGTGSTPNATTAAQNVAKNVCGQGQPTVTDYKKDSNPAKYQMVSFSDDYRDMNAPPRTSKNLESNLVKALGGKSGCNGLQVGSNIVYTFYADTIEKAQADLVAQNDALEAAGLAPRQNVMVILSDGDANSTSTYIESSRIPNQCLQGITAAQAATAAGTWVYSVAYAAGNTPGGTCTLDTSTVPGVTVTVVRTTTTYTQSYSNKNKSCGQFQAGQPQDSTLQQYTVDPSAAPAPGKTATTTTAQTPSGACSKNNSPITYTKYYDTTTVNSTPLTNYDRTACDTMRALASSPDKFFAVNAPGAINGCTSEANPNTTDLLTVFKKVATSLMKKRRAPKSAI